MIRLLSVTLLALGALLLAPAAAADRAQEAELAKRYAPIVRLGGAECPVPYNPALEKAAVPQTPDIIGAARGLVKGRI